MTNPLKSLQHLARKQKAKIVFSYIESSGNYKWYGEFERPSDFVKSVGYVKADKSFTKMLQKLYKEVRKI